MTFHGIGMPPDGTTQSEAKYWIDSPLFEAVIGLVGDLRRRYPLSLTFDDGNRSDYAKAMPVLIQAGLTASFFVLAGKIDQPGYLSGGEIREMAAAGMTIGLHGKDHIDWTRADDHVLAAELRDARQAIARLVAKPVTDVAIPFGRYDGRVVRALRDENFANIYTSDGGIRLLGGTVRARNSVRRDTDVIRLENTVRQAFGFAGRAVTEMRYQVKSRRPRRSL
jgi:peptidoglycan/xylan/chitin deacetylase (PgdA/CDA1 family)